MVTSSKRIGALARGKEEADGLEWRDGYYGAAVSDRAQSHGRICAAMSACRRGTHAMARGYDHEACCELEAHGGFDLCQPLPGQDLSRAFGPGSPPTCGGWASIVGTYMDVVPGLAAFRLQHLLPEFSGTVQYRDMAYVQAECAALAGQLAAIRSPYPAVEMVPR